MEKSDPAVGHERTKKTIDGAILRGHYLYRTAMFRIERRCLYPYGAVWWGFEIPGT